VTGDRRYPRYPLLGVGALIFERDRILMAQRGKPPLAGQWSIPGGLVETGERLADAVRREVLEETGLQVEPLAVLEIFERIIWDREARNDGATAEYHYVLIDYVCRVAGGSLAAGDDACRVEWVRRRDLPALDITEGTLAVIEKGFRNRRKYK
jgi:8-oxo-dGTP diphosphatase